MTVNESGSPFEMDEPQHYSSTGQKMPPPSPPYFVQRFGYSMGLEKMQEKARAEWNAKYGDFYDALRKAT